MSRNSLPSIDLHRLTAAEAERAIALALQTWRVQGVERAVLVTGRGYGNLRQEPVLRTKVEQWLRGDAARRLGVKSYQRVARDGAIEVLLEVRGRRPE